MVDYVKIKFKGGWALLARGEFDATKYELYTEPEPAPAPAPKEAEPPEEVTRDEPRSGGRKRTVKR
ncbi:MAG: hypothetical protein BWY99_02886 [Synergistetes bacterium ADurb.BinA166]|nr:MAG: hypothetical protein BWY99_02886 [Synergistetes bacterium ADurb.BinA166]